MWVCQTYRSFKRKWILVSVHTVDVFILHQLASPLAILKFSKLITSPSVTISLSVLLDTVHTHSHLYFLFGFFQSIILHARFIHPMQMMLLDWPNWCLTVVWFYLNFAFLILNFWFYNPVAAIRDGPDRCLNLGAIFMLCQHWKWMLDASVSFICFCDDNDNMVHHK